MLSVIHHPLFPNCLWRVQFDALHTQFLGRFQRHLGHRRALRVHMVLLTRHLLLGQEHGGRIVRCAGGI